MSNHGTQTTDSKKPMVGSERRRLHLGGKTSKIEADPEMMRFVDGLLLTETFKSIARMCAERFGPALAPGKSAVHRYWTNYHAARVRQEYSMKFRAARARKK